MNNLENNKLIAEFIGLDEVKCVRDVNGKYYNYSATDVFSCIKEQEIQIESENGWGLVDQDYLFIEDLKFHSDWNWLMQVINKIYESNQYYDYLQTFNNFLGAAGIDINTRFIAVTYDSVVDFIKWYNLNK